MSIQIGKRHCYCIPETGFVQGKGYRVSIVVENEPWHRPTSWFWGFCLKNAQNRAVKWNREVLGLTRDQTHRIICSSMFALTAKRGRKMYV